MLQAASPGNAMHACVIEERYDFSYLHCALESNVILGGCTPFYCGRNMPPMYFLCGSSFLAQMLKIYTRGRVESRAS